MRLARQSILKLSFLYLVQWIPEILLTNETLQVPQNVHPYDAECIPQNTWFKVDQRNPANSSKCTPLQYEVCRKTQSVYQLMLGIIKLTHSRKLCSKRWGIKNQFVMENKKKSEGLLPIFFLLSLLLASLVQFQVKIFVKSNWFHDISFRVLSGVALLSYLYF